MNCYAKVVIPGLIVIMPLVASAQDDSGVLSVTVYGPNSETVADMPIQATHAGTGEYERTRSAADGQYELIGLPAGLYKLTISTICCVYQSYENDKIAVAAGETTSLEIHLEEGTTFNTLADDPSILAAVVRNRQEIPDLPVPRLPNGTPNLSGMWLIGEDPYPRDAEAHPWAEELFAERIANNLADLPDSRCLPGGPPIPALVPPALGKFVQTADLLIILFEAPPGFRQVFLDGRNHPDDPNPSWLGHSIGQWDGDVLVVDTVGYNDRGWMGAYPRTEDLHLIERYKRTEYGRIDLEVTIEDPTVFKAPWIRNLPLELAPQEELIEYVCENDKWGQ